MSDQRDRLSGLTFNVDLRLEFGHRQLEIVVNGTNFIDGAHSKKMVSVGFYVV